MIEPPKPGFTGVVWEARPPEQLARDLATGPGSVPMVEAAAAWTRLAAGFGAAVLEYEQVLADMRGAWQSGRSSAVLEQVSTLREWLVDAAANAASNAALLETQVASYEIARLSMPDSADIANIKETQRLLETIGAMLGAPIRAIAADTDAEMDMAKAVASRVMRSYESATEPLATPWQHREPPTVAPDTALAAEQAGVTAAGQSAGTAGLRGMAIPIGGVALPTPMPRVQSVYRAPTIAQTTVTEEVTAQPTRVAPAATAGQAVPMTPGAAGQAAGTSETARFPRAGLASGEGADHLGMDGEIQAAPAVLGGSDAHLRAPAPTEAHPESGGSP